jgi:hypothetical protein
VSNGWAATYRPSGRCAASASGLNKLHYLDATPALRSLWTFGGRSAAARGKIFELSTRSSVSFATGVVRRIAWSLSRCSIELADPDFFDAFAARRQLVNATFTLDSTDLETCDTWTAFCGLRATPAHRAAGAVWRSVQIRPSRTGNATTWHQSRSSHRIMRVDMQRRNLIIPGVGDFGGPKALRAVGAWLRDHHARVNVFYTSNVEQYLFRDSAWERFYQNVGSMPLDTNAAFIRSATNAPYGGSQGFLMTSLFGQEIRGAQAGTRTTGLVLTGLTLPLAANLIFINPLSLR